tara:strand:- start:1745 stop:3163 length:1419 start_codon:yes stop_codon:yes gene_type:complete
MAALQASGAISFQNIEEHYNPGSNLPSRGLSEFYLGGSLVRANASNNSSTNMSAGVPASGTISLNDFYGKERAFKKTFSDGNTNQSADTIFGDDFEVDYPKQLVISSGHTIGATSTSNAALTIESNGVGSITITNDGNIHGAGGAAGAAGGNALEVAGSVAVALVNNGTIKAGGGGGGTGGTGGNGVYTANATFSSVTDVGGGAFGNYNTPQNNMPSWMNSIYTGGGDLDGQGVVGDRRWRGINGQYARYGVGSSTQFRVNHGGGAGDSINGNCANRGPMYISAVTNTTGVYTVSAAISSQYGSGYGTPTISVSTSTSSAGTSVSNSGTANITASTTTYFTTYGTASNNKDYYYNSLSFSVSGTCLAIQSGTSGGAGGVGQGYNQSATAGSSASSASNNAGAGGAGGAGGAFGASGSTGSTGSNGSGSSVSFPSSAPTNGSSGSAGGASGKSIQGNSNVTRTGSGTLTGDVA